jgi:hypothetical protein
MIWAMAKSFVLPERKRGRGNPNWGKPIPPVHAIRTEFEREVARLHLRKSQYVVSEDLKRWCGRNRNRVYVPEWLLAEWGMNVDLNFSAA